MTTQSCFDTFIYNGKKYELFESEGGKLIEPQDYGMNPEFCCTSCWRGFESTYEINSEGLFLSEMTVCGEVKEGYKSIGGIEPETYDGSYDSYCGNPASYRDLKLLTSFTGKLKLVKPGYNFDFSFATDLNIPFTVEITEFVFEAGKLQSIPIVWTKKEK